MTEFAAKDLHFSSNSDAQAVSVRSIVTAVCLIAISVWWDEWMTYFMSGSNISRSHFPLALLLPFLLLCILNTVAHRCCPRRALTKPELLVVLGTGLVAISVPYDGVTGHLISIIASPYYFATPENQWGTYVHDAIPPWLVPSNAQNEMVVFFEGLPVGQAMPVGVWMTPLFWWSCLVGALCLAVFCLVVMLRKQWMQNERLSYPLVEAGSLLSDTEIGGQMETQLRSPLFWVAFGLVMALKLVNVGSYFSPAFPRISIEGGNFQALPDFPRLITRVSFYAIGFSYFARLDVLLSVWFFIFTTACEVYVFNILGYKLGASPSQWGSQALGHQSLGALLFLACWSLWMARRHLGQVWRKATGKDPSIDDSEELLSYRTSVFGFIGAFLFCAGWLLTAGMTWWVVLVFLSVSLLSFVGLSRVVAELGLVYVYYRVQPTEFLLKSFGARVLGAASVVVLSLTRGIGGIGKGFVMPAFTQAVKAVDGAVKPRRVALVLSLAIGLGYTLSIADTLYLGYAHGAYNLGNYGLRKSGPSVFNAAVKEVLNPTPFGGKGRANWVGVGALVMAVLTLVRYRFSAWPLHPIGFALQGNYGLTKTWMSIFIAWGIKSVLMRIGGAGLYERGKPFFVGLIVAQVVSTALVFVVDWVWFPMHGHNVHNY